jgi:TPR repeat protein
VPQSYERAVELYEQAAAKGHASAQYSLGVLYYNGQGVPKDVGEERRGGGGETSP